MSNEKWEKMEDWEIKIHRRIEELEKIIGQKSWYKKDIGSIIDILEKEIAELREDDVKLCPICGKFLDGDKEWNDYAHSLIPVKREDLQFMVKNISLIYGHEFEEKLKYFKEEYSI